jgi:hypothetical protein
MTSQLDNTWTNLPTMYQLPKSSPLLSLLHQSHDECVLDTCVGNGFLALHWIYMNLVKWPFESIKVEWTWTQNGGVFGVPMLSYPNPYISTKLGSRVVVWVFGWLVNDTQNTHFANLNTNFVNLGAEESHIKCALSNPCLNPFLLPHHVYKWHLQDMSYLFWLAHKCMIVSQYLVM